MTSNSRNACDTGCCTTLPCRAYYETPCLNPFHVTGQGAEHGLKIGPRTTERSLNSIAEDEATEVDRWVVRRVCSPYSIVIVGANCCCCLRYQNHDSMPIAATHGARGTMVCTKTGPVLSDGQSVDRSVFSPVVVPLCCQSGRSFRPLSHFKSHPSPCVCVHSIAQLRSRGRADGVGV